VDAGVLLLLAAADLGLLAWFRRMHGKSARKERIMRSLVFAVRCANHTIPMPTKHRLAKAS
jgi:hypothetical protein